MGRGGGGEGAAILPFLFSFPCSADHKRDWPPCKLKYLSRVGNRYHNNNNTLNEKNNTRYQQGAFVFLSHGVGCQRVLLFRHLLIPPHVGKIDGYLQSYWEIAIRVDGKFCDILPDAMRYYCTSINNTRYSIW